MSRDGSTLTVASTQVGDRQAYIKVYSLQRDSSTKEWIQLGNNMFEDEGSTHELSYPGSRLIVGTRFRDSATGIIEVIDFDGTSSS